MQEEHKRKDDSFLSEIMKLLTTLLFLLSFSAQACDVTLSWIPPTETQMAVH